MSITSYDLEVTRALAYAWGREDASGTPTRPWTAPRTPSLTFAEAYASMRTEYNARERWFAFPLRDAYDRWQETDGETIYQPGESTPEWLHNRGSGASHL